MKAHCAGSNKYSTAMFLLVFFKHSRSAELSSKHNSTSPRWPVGQRHVAHESKRKMYPKWLCLLSSCFSTPIRSEKAVLVALVRRKCFSNASTPLLSTRNRSWKRATDSVSLYPILRVWTWIWHQFCYQNKTHFKSHFNWKMPARWEEWKMHFRKALSAFELTYLLISSSFLAPYAEFAKTWATNPLSVKTNPAVT